MEDLIDNISDYSWRYRNICIYRCMQVINLLTMLFPFVKLGAWCRTRRIQLHCITWSRVYKWKPWFTFITGSAHATQYWVFWFWTLVHQERGHHDEMGNNRVMQVQVMASTSAALSPHHQWSQSLPFQLTSLMPKVWCISGVFWMGLCITVSVNKKRTSENKTKWYLFSFFKVSHQRTRGSKVNLKKIYSSPATSH